MPRTPSPPRYRPRQYNDRRDDRDRSLNYRDRPFQPRREYDNRDYRRDRRDWDDSRSGRGGPVAGPSYRRGRSRSRSLSRDRDRDTSRSREHDRHREDTFRRDNIPTRRSSPERSKATSTRSGSPEEGQITASPAPPHNRTPPPPRARSPPRRGVVPQTPPWKKREREREKGWVDRERGNWKERDRDFDYRDRRAPPRSPVHRIEDNFDRDKGRDRDFDRRDRTRDHSPATSSRSRSSRYSPEKRSRPSSIERERRKSPDRRSRNSISPERRIPTSQPESYPNLDTQNSQPTIPPPFRTAATERRNPSSFGNIRPPSGPRSERIPPTGPSSLAIPSGPRSFALPSTTPVVVPQTPIAPTRPPPDPRPASVSTPNPATNPIPSPTSHRLSWSERKAVASVHSPTEYKQEKPLPPSQTETHIEEDIKPKVEPAPVKEEKPKLTETEIEEIRLREEDARIMSQLPSLKMPFGKAQWEIDLDNHYKRMAVLQHNTNRAQSANRIAAAVLADAEAERLAATERSRITESQLMVGTLGIISGV